MIDSLMSLFILGTIYFAVFIVVGYVFLMLLILMIRLFKRLAYGKDDADKHFKSR